jgi:transcriptional regulator with XRE-family HTH domain
MLDPNMTGPPERQPLLRTMFGEVLRRKRLEQGRTLADVARAAKVSMPYLSELERGRKEASSEILAAICAALGIDVADLLGEVMHVLAPAPQAQVIGLHQARHDRPRSDAQSARLGGGDVVCLLAA